MKIYTQLVKASNPNPNLTETALFSSAFSDPQSSPQAPVTPTAPTAYSAYVATAEPQCASYRHTACDMAFAANFAGS